MSRSIFVVDERSLQWGVVCGTSDVALYTKREERRRLDGREKGGKQRVRTG